MGPGGACFAEKPQSFALGFAPVLLVYRPENGPPGGLQDLSRCTRLWTHSKMRRTEARCTAIDCP